MKKFTYKGTNVGYRQYETGNIPEELQKTCFCCKKKINKCSAVLLINNYQKIPNVLIHSECFSEWEKENKINELLENIEKSYNQWIQLNDIFGSFLKNKQME